MKIKNLFFSYLLIVASIFLVSCTASLQLGDRSVLDSMQLGKEALRKKEFAKAEKEFIKASKSINEIWGENEEANKARSLWYSESVKPFKGEAYERMMVFYYLGIIFLMKEDYGNAQAAFKQAILQDAFAEEEQYQADIKLSAYLQGVALSKLGSIQNAQQAFQQFQKFNPNFAVPQPKNIPNTLIIVESGNAPVKYTTGKYDEIIQYRRGKSISQINISIENKNHVLLEGEDIYWQASTRGGRPIKAIIDNKIAFKETTEVISDISANIFEGIVRSGNARNNDDALLLLGATAIVAGVLSTSTKPAADSRHWDNLPDKIYFQHLHLSDASYTIEITDNEKTVIEEISVKKDKLNIVYVIL